MEGRPHIGAEAVTVGIANGRAQKRKAGLRRPEVFNLG
jgi:hypothetical protein